MWPSGAGQNASRWDLDGGLSMLQITRADALAKVKAMKKNPKAIVWARIWGFSVEDIAAAMRIRPVTVEKHIADLCKEWGCEVESLALILIMGEGIRMPDMVEWSGLNNQNIYPQGEEDEAGEESEQYLWSGSEGVSQGHQDPIPIPEGGDREDSFRDTHQGDNG